jgi:uncharacterized membrane protein YdjX (TVP38/TMEM64 family)
MTDATPSPDPRQSRRRWLLWSGLGAVALLLVAGGGLYFSLSQNPAVVKYRELARFYSSRQEIRRFLKRAGPFAPLVFVALQALQVVVAPVPGEATGILGGFLFGTVPGFLYSTIGLTLGSALAFGLARWLGQPLVRRLVPESIFRRFDFLAKAGGEMVTFVLFLIPGFPKDILCFILGLSPMPFGMFLVTTSFGRMPGTWLLSMQGAKIYSGYYLEFILLLVVAASAIVLAYNYREQIYAWVHRQQDEKPDQGPPAPR